MCRSTKSVDAIFKHPDPEVAFLGQVTKNGDPWTSTVAMEAMGTLGLYIRAYYPQPCRNTLFTKLDARRGYLPVSLDQQSSYLPVSLDQESSINIDHLQQPFRSVGLPIPATTIWLEFEPGYVPGNDGADSRAVSISR